MRIIDLGERIINIDTIAQVQLDKRFSVPYALEIRFVSTTAEENSYLTLPRADTEENAGLFATYIMDIIVDFLADTDENNTVLDLTVPVIAQKFTSWVNEGKLKPYKPELVNDFPTM